MGLLRQLTAVPAIISINLIVFLAWQLGVEHPVWGERLFVHGMVSAAHLDAGHVWTLLTSAFSHVEVWHVALNMFVLYNFGAILELGWGWRRFLVFYVGACLASGLVHVAFSWMGWPDHPALGASGGVCGLLMAFVFLYPRHKLLLFMVIPLPAWTAALLLVGLDVWGLASQHDGGGLPIGHGAHLGGALFGALWSIAGWKHLDRFRLPIRTPA